MFMKPEVEGSRDGWIIDTRFSDDVRIGVSINTREAKVKVSKALIFKALRP
jgi:hypothetical protein